MCQDLRQRSISVRQWSSWAWGNLPMGHQGEPPLCPCSAIHHCHSVISSSAGAGDPPEDECHPPGTVAVWGLVLILHPSPLWGILFLLL